MIPHDSSGVLKESTTIMCLYIKNHAKRGTQNEISQRDGGRFPRNKEKRAQDSSGFLGDAQKNPELFQSASSVITSF